MRSEKLCHSVFVYMSEHVCYSLPYVTRNHGNDLITKLKVLGEHGVQKHYLCCM